MSARRRYEGWVCSNGLDSPLGAEFRLPGSNMTSTNETSVPKSLRFFLCYPEASKLFKFYVPGSVGMSALAPPWSWVCNQKLRSAYLLMLLTLKTQNWGSENTPGLSSPAALEISVSQVPKKSVLECPHCCIFRWAGLTFWLQPWEWCGVSREILYMAQARQELDNLWSCKHLIPHPQCYKL